MLQQDHAPPLLASHPPEPTSCQNATFARTLGVSTQYHSTLGGQNADYRFDA
jgi:hypothetical protein